MRTLFQHKSKPIVGVVQGSPQAGKELKKELALHVRKEIGPIAVPDKIQFAPSLPKTRSGKNHAPHSPQDC
jgi:acyl-coenzyme A synthetase/AMP-(fatty) acid ligase